MSRLLAFVHLFNNQSRIKEGGNKRLKAQNIEIY